MRRGLKLKELAGVGRSPVAWQSTLPSSYRCKYCGRMFSATSAHQASCEGTLPSRLFILYDGRAKFEEGLERATVFTTADDEAEARDLGSTDWAGYDAIWYEYDDSGKKELGEGKARWDLPPAADKPAVATPDPYDDTDKWTKAK